MKFPKIIIGVILLSLILSVPTYAGAKNDKININIYAERYGYEEIQLNSVCLNVGKSLNLTKGIITYQGKKGREVSQCPNGHIPKWKSSNSKVVSVSQKGVIRAKKAGEAVITLKCGKTVCKLKVYVNSKKFLSKGKQLEKRIDALYKKYAKASSINDSNIEQVITTTAKLKRDCIYYGYEFCDKWNYNVGKKVERKPQTTGKTYCELSEQMKAMTMEDDGKIYNYTLYHNGKKLQKVADNIRKFLVKKNPYDSDSQDCFEIQDIEVKNNNIYIKLKKAVTKNQVLGGLLFNGALSDTTSVYEENVNTVWTYLLPQKTPSEQKVPIDICIMPYDSEESLQKVETWINGRKKSVYARNAYSLNATEISFKLKNTETVGINTKSLAAGKYIIGIGPINGNCSDLLSNMEIKYNMEHKNPEYADFNTNYRKTCILSQFEVK